MPWKECRKMSLKLDFIERVRSKTASMSAICKDFGISRQTGAKWKKRYEEEGYAGLEERTRRPKSSPLALAEELVVAILELRNKHPTWGARKLHGVLVRRYADGTPSVATISRILKRAGKVRARRKRPLLSVVDRAPSVEVNAPNDLWTIDFKGWWRTYDGERCEPLTVRDAFSKYVLKLRLLGGTRGDLVHPEMERLFKKHGVPKAIGCDNGSPFISPQGRGGFTQLSAWWSSLGVKIVRSRPGCPQDNGGHERMHRDLAQEVENSPARDLASQQRELDRWRQDFNHIRPHEALGGKTPGEVYKPSGRRLRDCRPFVYAAGLLVRQVDRGGNVHWRGDSVRVGPAFRGHRIGLERLEGLRWRVWFGDIDIGAVELLPDWVDDVAGTAHRAARKSK
jgi:putative transposase